jgi:hypothetical protein
MIYLRIYNAHSIAAATKYIQFTALYEITSVATQNVTIIPTYGWSSWINKAVTPLVSGAITNASLPLSGITVACTGQTSYVTNETGLYSFSVPTGANITITPTKTGYYFTPASRSYTNVTEAISDADFAMTKSAPNTATNPDPANSANNISQTLGQVAWDYVPLDGYALPTGFNVYFPLTAAPVFVAYVPGIVTYYHPVPLLDYNTLYNWKVVPTNDNPAKGANVAASRADNSKADASDVIEWAFTTRNPLLITPGVPEGIDPDGAGPLGTFVFNTPEATVEDPTPVIEYTLVELTAVPPFVGIDDVTNAFAINLAANGYTRLEVDHPAGEWYGIAYYGGAWHPGVAYPSYGPGTIVWDNIVFPAKGDVPIILSQDQDPVLPVELSSFTAIYSAGFFVQLTWIVQSETNHLGYYILRNDSESLTDAITLNTSPISSGSSTGTQITYNYRDEEIVNNSIYYYWLESVDLDGTSHFFGPVSVIVGSDVPDDPIPPIPVVTELRNAYPNPFGLLTRIPYSLKTQSDVKIEIFNVKGQMIYNYTENQKAAGYHSIDWNGKDMNGKAVSSGIYYYRMSSGKYTASKKIVLVK